MTEQEYERFNEFINTTLYETMTDDDYYEVMDSLDVPHNGHMFKTCCHNEDLSHAKYNLSLYNKTFTCFSECNGEKYSLLSLVKKRFELIGEPKSTVQCIKYICKICDIPFDFNTKEVEVKKKYNWKYLKKYVKGYKEEVEEIIYDDEILNFFPKTYYQEWLNYGISKETLDKYEIGWYSYRQQITIPCRDYNGNLIGIRVRNLDKDAEAKYIPLQLLDSTSYKFPTGNYFYGENFNFERIKQTKKVWLVEAEKTVLKMDTWSNGNNTSLGLYGSNFTDVKLNRLLKLEPSTIYIAIDSDFHEVGDEEYKKFEEKVYKIGDKLNPYVQNIEVIYNNCGFDGYKYSPTDFTREQFNELWKRRERIK
ncbi:MAG: hypothetical protein BV457_03425 [Thermoplasmata archaeon M9B1D]|nr:MAG: hypothetical protein BV457_03425 [Thermoplasmata archaeon M9B1D]